MQTNNKKTITICSIIALIILAIVIIITLIANLKGFTIILSALFIILTVCLSIYIKEEPDEYTIYIKNKKKILRLYDSIIVEVEEIPNIAGKNIIKVKSIEDLVDAQLELREPIYYKNDNDSCFFMLLHYNEACIYILKMNDSVISPTEQSIRYMKEDTEAKEQDQSILDNIENTIVYKLDELRSFKISPIRNQEKIDVVDDTAIKEEIEHNQDANLTTKLLEGEISKTKYIKDLQEKIRQFELEEEEKSNFNFPLEKEESNIVVAEDTSLKISATKKEETSKEEKKEKPKVTKKTSKKASKKPTPKRQTHATRRAAKYTSKKQ